MSAAIIIIAINSWPIHARVLLGLEDVVTRGVGSRAGDQAVHQADGLDGEDADAAADVIRRRRDHLVRRLVAEHVTDARRSRVRPEAGGRRRRLLLTVAEVQQIGDTRACGDGDAELRLTIDDRRRPVGDLVPGDGALDGDGHDFRPVAFVGGRLRDGQGFDGVDALAFVPVGDRYRRVSGSRDRPVVDVNLDGSISEVDRRRVGLAVRLKRDEERHRLVRHDHRRNVDGVRTLGLAERDWNRTDRLSVGQHR